jgi:hypothetical protein
MCVHDDDHPPDQIEAERDKPSLVRMNVIDGDRMGIDEHSFCVREADPVLPEIRPSLGRIPDRCHVCIICICSEQSRSGGPTFRSGRRVPRCRRSGQAVLVPHITVDGQPGPNRFGSAPKGRTGAMRRMSRRQERSVRRACTPCPAAAHGDSGSSQSGLSSDSTSRHSLSNERERTRAAPISNTAQSAG